MEPKISVVIPVFNTGIYAGKLLKELHKNPYKNLEIIIIDDGSKDESAEVIKKVVIDYEIKNAKMFSLPKNRGASAARNLGIEKATGDYISFLDSDDDIDENFYIALTATLKDDSVLLPLTSIRENYMNSDKQIYKYYSLSPKQKEKENIKEYILKLLLKDGRLYPVVNKLFDLSVIKEAEIRFDEEFNFAEDLKFVLDYLKAAKIEKIVTIDKPLYTYNYGMKTSTVKKSGKKWKNWEKSYKHLVKWVGRRTTRLERRRLKLIRLRWRISYLKSRLRR